MKKREYWMKLFAENDTALATAIHLCERFVTEEQLENGEEFLTQKRKELDEEIPAEIVEETFGELYER